MVITIGQLRERVELQELTTTRDSIGGIIETWTTTDTLWAKVEPMSAGEQYRRQQIQAGADWKITTRYRRDISPTPQMRFRWQGHTFEIKGVTNADMLRRFSTFTCAELQAVADDFGEEEAAFTFDSTVTTFDSTELTWDAA